MEEGACAKDEGRVGEGRDEKQEHPSKDACTSKEAGAGKNML